MRDHNTFKTLKKKIQGKGYSCSERYENICTKYKYWRVSLTFNMHAQDEVSLFLKKDKTQNPLQVSI